MYYYYLGPYQWIDNSWQAPVGAVASIDLRNLTQMGTAIVQNGVGFFATTDKLDAEYGLLGQGDLRDIHSTETMKSMWNSLLSYTPNGDKLVDLLYDHLTLGSDPSGQDASKTLMPTRGNLTVHLQGHSPVKSTQFRIGHSPESNRIISVLQNDYREVRDLALDNLNNMPVNQHKKLLDFLSHQYNIKNPEDIFIPKDLPKELPEPHNTLISENFNGTDNAAVGKQLTWVEGGDGSFWDNFNSHARILDPAAGGDLNERAIYANSALSGVDQKCTVLHAVHSRVVTSEGGPVCRRSNSAVTYYILQMLFNNDLMSLGKVIAGVGSAVGSSVAITPSSPDTTRLEVIGSNLEGFLNDTSELIVTDTSISGGLYCGLYGYHGVADDLEFDNWSAEDIIIPSAGAGNGATVLTGLL